MKSATTMSQRLRRAERAAPSHGDSLRSRPAGQRYAAWRELVDFSVQLALAGLAAQGVSRRAAWAVWRRRWTRAARDHQRANRHLARQLAARDRVSQP